MSNNEEKISNFLVKFAKDLNLEVYQDENLNVIIKKNGTEGYENSQSVILQGHLDMVCEKNEGKKHNFYTEPINLIIKDDYIYADGTTLGADNGIAVAYVMALLASKGISHPPLEVLLTTEEEVGLNGAQRLEKGLLKSNLLINLDSEEEGIITVSCAGGSRTTTSFKYSKEKTLGQQIRIFVKGLNGGHSGMDIDKHKENAIKILSRILFNLKNKILFNIVSIDGGSKMNAIPREASCVVTINPKDRLLLETLVNDVVSEIKDEIIFYEKTFDVTCKGAQEADYQLDMISSYNLIDLLNLYPNGVYKMSPNIKDLVLTSSNIGVIKTDDESILIQSAVRSNKGSLKEYLLKNLETLSNQFSCKFEVTNSYPEWEYKENSKLRDLAVKTYKNMFKLDPTINAIHAGLECGILSQKIENADMISIGPSMYDVHTPNEHLDIKSTVRTYDYLLELLKSLK